MDSLSIDTLAGKIFAGFLAPAASIPPEQWRERYKVINRGAGCVAGLALALRPEGDERDQCIVAEEIVRQAGLLMASVSRPGPQFEQRTINSLCHGLRKRTAKCVLALHGCVAPEVVS